MVSDPTQITSKQLDQNPTFITLTSCTDLTLKRSMAHLVKLSEHHLCLCAKVIATYRKVGRTEQNSDRWAEGLVSTLYDSLYEQGLMWWEGHGLRYLVENLLCL